MVDTAEQFLARMTVKLGTTPAQLKNRLLGKIEDDSPIEPPNFITGTSPFIKYIKPKVEYVPERAQIITTTLSTTESEEAQKFLEGTDTMSSGVRDALIEWASDYFALQLGIQDAIEFSSQSIPSDIGVEKSILGVKQKLESAMSHRLVSTLARDVLKCDEDIMSIFEKGQNPNPAIPQEIYNRFLKIAKDASASKETKGGEK